MAYGDRGIRWPTGEAGTRRQADRRRGLGQLGSAV